MYDIPILLITFNRPIETQIVFDEIKKIKPKYLYVSSDGARKNVASDPIQIKNTRSILNQIDWDCEVHTLFQDENKGCFKAVNEAITWFFTKVDYGIILEDDCCPTPNFFTFMSWALKEFEHNHEVGLVSGSNLIDYLYTSKNANGFSHLINIWGWGSWSRVWQNHNQNPTLQDIYDLKDILKEKFNFWQTIFWIELFKLTILKKNTWDFQLQYTFFKQNLVSVFPKYNLIFNIGYNNNGTHTNTSIPDFVLLSKPKDDNLAISNYSTEIKTDMKRDLILAKKIWHFNVYSTVKLYLGNILRKLNII